MAAKKSKPAKKTAPKKAPASKPAKKTAPKKAPEKNRQLDGIGRALTSDAKFAAYLQALAEGRHRATGEIDANFHDYLSKLGAARDRENRARTA